MPLPLTPAQVTAMRIEDGIRNNRTETGVLIAPDGSVIHRARGSQDEVPIDAIHLSRVADITMTHNHPNNTGFSVKDVQLAVRYRFAELRVVTRRHRYRMTNLKHIPDEEIHQACVAAIQLVRPTVQEEYILRRIRSDELDTEILHRAWMVTKDRLGFTYVREK